MSNVFTQSDRLTDFYKFCLSSDTDAEGTRTFGLLSTRVLEHNVLCLNPHYSKLLTADSNSVLLFPIGFQLVQDRGYLSFFW